MVCSLTTLSVIKDCHSREGCVCLSSLYLVRIRGGHFRLGYASSFLKGLLLTGQCSMHVGQNDFVLMQSSPLQPEYGRGTCIFLLRLITQLLTKLWQKNRGVGLSRIKRAKLLIPSSVDVLFKLSVIVKRNVQGREWDSTRLELERQSTLCRGDTKGDRCG